MTRQRFLLSSLLAIQILTALSSCNNPEKAALREKLSTEYNIEKTVAVDTFSVIRYYEAELAENRLFVDNLEKAIQKGFDKQVDEFEEQELGIFASYKYMFNRVFLSKQRNHDLWKVKTNRYFSNLEIQQDVYSAYVDYTARVEALRSTLSNSMSDTLIIAKMPAIDIPSQEVYLDAFSHHSLNNIFIEFGADIAAWLLVLTIIGVLGLFGITWSKKYSLVATLLSLAISVVLSLWNDRKMVESVREQGREITSVNYANILQNLNEKSYEFYETLL